LTKPRKKLPELAKLLPGSKQMKGLEDRYRKELGVTVEGGFVDSLDAEDMMLTSFLNRFVRAVNDNLPYYSDEQARKLLVETKGLMSWKVTVVFNRGGKVEDVRFKSTGSTELDQSLMRAIHAVGPLGSLPKSYDRDLLKVPFIYTLSDKRMSG
jgi:protein TonB